MRIHKVFEDYNCLHINKNQCCNQLINGKFKFHKLNAFRLSTNIPKQNIINISD